MNIFYRNSWNDVLLFENYSKLLKNENITDISLYKKYLLKFHKNILKYYRLHLFKKSVYRFTAKHSEIFYCIFRRECQEVQHTFSNFLTVFYWL